MRVVMVTSPGTPFPLLWLVQLLLWFHSHGPQLTEAAPPCPSPCICSNQASRVICTRRSLDQIPDSISENTRYLNLQENSIQVILVSSTNGKHIKTLKIDTLRALCLILLQYASLLFVSTLGDQV